MNFNKDVVNAVLLWHHALICNTLGLKGLTKVSSTFMTQPFHISVFNKDFLCQCMLEIVTSNFASQDQKDGEMLLVRRLSE